MPKMNLDYMLLEWQFCKLVANETKQYGGGTWKPAMLESYEPGYGYAVGTHGEYMPLAKLDARVVWRFIQETGLARCGPFLGLGTWVDADGMVSIDTIMHLTDISEAIDLAHSTEQTYIWDFAREKAIAVPRNFVPIARKVNEWNGPIVTLTEAEYQKRLDAYHEWQLAKYLKRQEYN